MQTTNSTSRRRDASLAVWRLSETLLLVGVFSLGLLILTIHLATWGVETRRETRLLTQIDCVVESRALRSRTDERGVAWFRPEVKINYCFGDETFVTQTFERATLTEDGGFYFDRAGALDALKPFAPGVKTRCWIRVDDPKQAFLVKPSAIWGWIFLVIPVSLILFGGGWLVVRFRDRSLSREALANVRRQKTRYPTVPNVPPIEDSPGVRLARRLRPDVKKSFEFGAATLGALAWNLASWSVFVYVVATAETAFDKALAFLFGAIFCGVGFLFACRLWGAFRIERVVGSTALEISELPILPGRKTRLCLFLRGRVAAKRLAVFVRCEEVARYLQGTNAICNKREAFSRTLFTKYDVDVPAGAEETEEFSTTLPLGVAPSFEAEHNEIVWKFVVQTEFADGGTYERDFGVVVYPAIVPER